MRNRYPASMYSLGCHVHFNRQRMIASPFSLSLSKYSLILCEINSDAVDCLVIQQWRQPKRRGDDPNDHRG
jgi:hypothetical protein